MIHILLYIHKGDFFYNIYTLTAKLKQKKETKNENIFSFRLQEEEQDE